jgi:hypothetical protein
LVDFGLILFFELFDLFFMEFLDLTRIRKEVHDLHEGLVSFFLEVLDLVNFGILLEILSACRFCLALHFHVFSVPARMEHGCLFRLTGHIDAIAVVVIGRYLNPLARHIFDFFVTKYFSIYKSHLIMLSQYAL